MTDIADAMIISLHRDLPNGNVWLSPNTYDPSAYYRKIDKLLETHPERMRYYCAILKKIAKHYDASSDFPIGNWDLELAASVARHSPGCLRQTIQELPPSPDARKLLEGMAEECQLNARWSPYACSIANAARSVSPSLVNRSPQQKR